MSFGASFTPVTFYSPPGPPFPANSADNGTSVDGVTGRIVLGNDELLAAGAAQFLSNREIWTNAFILRLLFGVNPTDPIMELGNAGLNLYTNNSSRSVGLTVGELNLFDDTGATFPRLNLDAGAGNDAEVGLIGDEWFVRGTGSPNFNLRTFLTSLNTRLGDGADNGQKLQVEGNISMDSATANLDFPNTAAQTSSDLTIALANAAVGDMVVLGVPVGAVQPDTCYTAFVDSPGSVTVRFNNYSAGAVDPNADDFTVSIFKTL